MQLNLLALCHLNDMDEKIRSKKDRFIPVMNRCNKSVQLVMEQQMQASAIGLTIKQYILLHRVGERERPQHELAMITNRDKGSLTRLIQLLEKKQFVKRSLCKNDSRKMRVNITKKGIDALKKGSEIVNKSFETIGKVLSDKEQATLIKICLKLNDRADDLQNENKS